MRTLWLVYGAALAVLSVLVLTLPPVACTQALMFVLAAVLLHAGGERFRKSGRDKLRGFEPALLTASLPFDGAVLGLSLLHPAGDLFPDLCLVPFPAYAICYFWASRGMVAHGLRGDEESLAGK